MKTNHKKELSENEVKHIAKLANLTLTNNEIQKFQKQLSAILEYMEVISSVDTANIPASNQITGLKNVSRGDQAQPSLTQEEAIGTSPSKHNGFIKVKAIFNE